MAVPTTTCYKQARTKIPCQELDENTKRFMMQTLMWMSQYPANELDSNLLDWDPSKNNRPDYAPPLKTYDPATRSHQEDVVVDTTDEAAVGVVSTSCSAVTAGAAATASIL